MKALTVSALNLLLGLGIATHTIAAPTIATPTIAVQPQTIEEEEHEPAEITIGERLFLETRFAQARHANPANANQVGDPTLDLTVTTTKVLPGPFSGQTISCRVCHMVDEHTEPPLGGMRSYTDYARRSPVPNREDGNKLTTRNSMPLVNIALAPFGSDPAGALFHFDGQFNSLSDLVRGTLTDRIFGWLPGEAKTAIKHIADVIRSDDGSGDLAKEFGGSYSEILSGKDNAIAPQFRLAPEYTVDVGTASDQQIVDAVAKLIAVYVSDLGFAKDDNGIYSGSPYDLFLAKNKLPRQPNHNETGAAYTQRLANAVTALKNPRFVQAGEKKFTSHQQTFQFGAKELQGMKLFFTRGSSTQHGGNCASCHSAPDFSDFQFHNSGLTQINYDTQHNQGQFVKLSVPDLEQRNKHYNRYLPATEQHPQATSRFKSVTDKNKPGVTDLGLWNVFANPDMPAPQAKIKTILCEQAKQRDIKHCTNDQLLNLSLAAFKTPVLRDLGHSAPYLHTGQADTLAQAINIYITSSALAKADQLRNADPALQHITIDAADVDLLVSFLKSLNEDYE